MWQMNWHVLCRQFSDVKCPAYNPWRTVCLEYIRMEIYNKSSTLGKWRDAPESERKHVRKKKRPETVHIKKRSRFKGITECSKINEGGCYLKCDARDGGRGRDHFVVIRGSIASFFFQVKLRIFQEMPSTRIKLLSTSNVTYQPHIA